MNEEFRDLPEEDQIVRYVKPSALHEDGTADGSAFLLRPDHPNDTGLSVNWLEVFEFDRLFQLAEIRRLCRLQLSRAGRFVEMNVGKVKREIYKELDHARIIHKPLEPEGEYDADPSHAQITGLPPGDSTEAKIIGELIAQKCVVDMHPVCNNTME